MEAKPDPELNELELLKAEHVAMKKFLLALAPTIGRAGGIHAVVAATLAHDLLQEELEEGGACDEFQQACSALYERLHGALQVGADERARLNRQEGV